MREQFEAYGDWWPVVGTQWRTRKPTPMGWGRIASLRTGKRQEVVVSHDPKMCANTVIPIAEFRNEWMPQSGRATA